jgi:hypothetical protein
MRRHIATALRLGRLRQRLAAENQWGPCGAVVSPVPTSYAVGRAFIGQSTGIVHVVMPAHADVQRYFNELVADHHEGCGSFIATTDDGRPVTVSDITFVDLDVPTSSIAWTFHSTSQIHETNVGVIAMQSAGRVAILQVGSATLIPAESVRRLADAVAARLAS